MKDLDSQGDLFNTGIDQELRKKDSKEPQDPQQEEEQEEEPRPFVTPNEIKYGYYEEELAAPVFDNGPTRLEVEQWKEKYKTVYFVPFDDTIFIFRSLARPEYREVVNNREITLMDREEIVTEKCVLYPRNYSRAEMNLDKAGRPSLLHEMIMDKSAFVAQSAPMKL